MKRTILALTCAVATAAVTTAAQTPQPKPQPQQQQEQQKQQPTQKPQSQMAQQKQIMLTGCVYQATDQPTMFALQRTTQDHPGEKDKPGMHAEGKPEMSGKPETAGKPGSTGQPTTGETEAMARQGEPRTGRGGEIGAWYQLSSDASKDLEQYVGKAVRVNGMLEPGKDEKGVDIVIHRVTRHATAVTAIDLKPAPRLKIQDITPTEGKCETKAQQ